MNVTARKTPAGTVHVVENDAGITVAWIREGGNQFWIERPGGMVFGEVEMFNALVDAVAAIDTYETAVSI